MKAYIKLVILIIIFSFNKSAQAQFFYEESCKNPTGIFGLNGFAKYTGGTIDPINDGWLRLTGQESLHQMGYVIVDDSYPTNLGLTVEFDFKVWKDEPGNPADGFSVYLFDGSITNDQFVPGYTGGALGYLPTRTGEVDPVTGLPVTKPGLKGGYLGVAIDELGNFKNYIPGVVLGGKNANSIIIAGPESSTYEMIAKTDPAFSGIANLSGTLLSHNVMGPRPADNVFYRRVRLQLDPAQSPSIGMDVTVYLKIDATGDFYKAIGPVNVPYVSPTTLRLGFAGATGSLTANHEVRNIVVKTSGALSVYKAVTDSCFTNEPNYDIQTIITSGVHGVISNIQVKDTLPPYFDVSNITILGGSFTTTPVANTPNEVLTDGRKVYNYSVNLPSVGTAKINWDGVFTKIPITKLNSCVGITPPSGFVDSNLEDNYAKEDYIIPKVLTKDTTITLTSNTITLGIETNILPESYIWQEFNSLSVWEDITGETNKTATLLFTAEENVKTQKIRCVAKFGSCEKSAEFKITVPKFKVELKDDVTTSIACDTITVDVLANDKYIPNSTVKFISSTISAKVSSVANKLVYTNANVTNCCSFAGKTDTVVYEVEAPLGSKSRANLIVHILNCPELVLLNECSFSPFLRLGTHINTSTIKLWQYVEIDNFIGDNTVWTDIANVTEVQSELKTGYYRIKINYNGRDVYSKECKLKVDKTMASGKWWYNASIL